MAVPPPSGPVQLHVRTGFEEDVVRLLSAELICGPDFELTVRAPEIVIPTIQDLQDAITNGRIVCDTPVTVDHHVCLIFPLHQWTVAWLRVMSANNSLPYLSVELLCVDDYAVRVQMGVNVDMAMQQFILNMLNHGLPPRCRARLLTAQ
jgi:hypothetical protein